MSTADGRFSQKTLDYLARMDSRFSGMAPRAIADRVVQLVQAHDEWRARRCLNMLAAENLLSRNARRLLAIPELREDVPWCLRKDAHPLAARLDKDGRVRKWA